MMFKKKIMSNSMFQKMSFDQNSQIKSGSGLPMHYSPISSNPAISGGNIVMSHQRGFYKESATMSGMVRPKFIGAWFS